MHNRIIDAIQEQYGEKYATLEDALNWWAWPEHWRRGAWDSDFVTGMKTVKTAFNRPFKKEEKGLEDAILTALKEMIGEEPGTIEKALERQLILTKLLMYREEASALRALMHMPLQR